MYDVTTCRCWRGHIVAASHLQLVSVVTIASEPASIDYDRSFEKNRDVDVDSMS